MKVVFKRAALKDIPQLVQLEKICFNTDRLSKKSFHHLLKVNSAEIIIAKAEKKLLGSIVIFFRKNSRKARMYSLAVHPDYRHQGIAQKLCKALEKKARARHCDEVVLEVRKDNQMAIHFYLNNDYKPFGEYKHFYEDGADALRMCKTYHT